MLNGIAVVLRPFSSSIAPALNSFFAAPTVAIAGGIGALAYSDAAGGSRQEHLIDGTDFTIQINIDQMVGHVYDGNGNQINVSVTATGVDGNGNPTGFIPTAEADAIRLGVFSGTDISADSVLGTTMNAEEVSETDGVYVDNSDGLSVRDST